MAENNTAQTAAEVAKPNKMARCRTIFNEIRAEGYTLPEGSSPRKEFIKRSIAEVQVSEACATTYYNNLQREAKGGKLYGGAKKAATVADVQSAEQQALASAGVEKSEEQEAGDAAANAALTEQASDTPAEEEAEQAE